MTGISLEALAQTLASALSRRLDLSDDRDMAMLVDQHLELRVLQNYREQLEGLDGAEAVAWLLRRMATIEARVLTLGGTAVTDTAQAPARIAVDDGVLLPRYATVAFDADLVQTGFYPMEVGLDDGSLFRWLGPEPQASVFLPKLVGPVEVVIAVYSAFIPDMLDKMRLSLDGGEVAGVEVRMNEHRYELVARLMPGPISHAGTMRLDIDAIQTATPAARGEPDSRYLSLAISRITVKSL